jgi:hypothetical protein
MYWKIFRTTVEHRKLVTEIDETLKIPEKTLWKARTFPHLRPRQQGTGAVGLSRIGFGVK